ncbi:MAG: stage 0 sporulation family protein [Candidatus Omnitrophica bacterium]|nr:stage 0 sporulation family protein [Candidatus Omnitrophota bacterium]MCM8831629.1 stage 0 sporulation family protein [Candidatus Omnitrophota bacterium]
MRIGLIRLRNAGQLMTYKITDDVNLNDYVIIEADRGLDYGEVIEITEADNNLTDNADKESSLKSIVRKVTPSDLEQIEKNKQEAKEAFKKCEEKIKEHKMELKLVDAEYSFDKKKIVFYFTAESRVDFRELVKDLAKIFKIRIEMRHIGVRDEARLFGGIGPCGQILCCVRFLKNFEAVTMKMAKIQKLSISSGKISGLCGRLMCCLFYEYQTYKQLSKGLPKEGQIVETSSGKGKVISVNVLKRIAYVEFEDGGVEKIFYPITTEEDKDE